MLHYDLNILHTLDYLGTAVFAITGAIAALRKNMDLFGVIVIAIGTAVGGGTLRDLLLKTHSIFWINNTTYLAIAVSSAIATIFMRKVFETFSRPIQFLDALGLAAFAIIGTSRSLSMHVEPIIAITMGILTGVGGGMIRDILCAKIPMVLRKEIYASAAFCGALIYIITLTLGFPTIATFLSLACTFSLRMAGIYWHWGLPAKPQPLLKKNKETSL